MYVINLFGRGGGLIIHVQLTEKKHRSQKSACIAGWTNTHVGDEVRNA